MKLKATAFAPATVGNVAVGFDVLGLAIDGVGDWITVSKDVGSSAVTIESVTGIVKGLPKEPALNTATAALLAMQKGEGIKFGFRVSVHKGIPLSSGMGGSAASAVGAVVAANELLPKKLPKEKLISYALSGESVASGSRHADNIAPCLFGGLAGVFSVNTPEVFSIPYPKGIFVALVHPALEVKTKEARAILRRELSLESHVEQSAALSAFLVGCFKRDLTLIHRGLKDVIVEPQRARLIPGFREVQKAALDNEALGCSISGAGPSMFAWAGSKKSAERIAKAMVNEFAAQNISTHSWVSPISPKGCRIVKGPPRS